jgi:trimeric autotransporter adhesin
MAYTDLGFDKLLNRRNAPSTMMDDATSRYITSLSGSNISGGITSSNTGTLSINWDTGEIKVNDGARSRVLLGYVAEEDAYGIKILNNLGEVVFSVAGQVGTGGIEDGAITEDKLIDGSVSGSKLGSGSVDTINIVDYAITDAKITSLSANKILAGDLVVAVDVGNPTTGYVRLDGVNNRILVHDGTNPRIVIGDI